VLNRHHAGVNAFLYRHFQWYVSGDWELLPPRLVDNPKEHVSRREVVHLN
jgi:surfactin synthase thioesterase subunit